MSIKTGGQIVCESLIREGVDVVFGLPGGAILPLYGTLSQYPSLRHILVRHEQGRPTLPTDTRERAARWALPLQRPAREPRTSLPALPPR